MSKNIATPIDTAIVAIRKAPKAGRNVLWSEDINTPYLVAIAVIRSDDQEAAAVAIAHDTGASLNSIRHFARGNMANSAPWPELRKMLSDAGIKWNDNKPGRPRNATSTATTPTADTVPPADFTVTPPAAPTTSITVRPAIDPNTGDILVITTRRILYGSPEHRAKMIEMNAKKA